MKLVERKEITGTKNGVLIYDCVSTIGSPGCGEENVIAV
jgi:hypothetical protein